MARAGNKNTTKDTAKDLPYNQFAEQAVIGSALLSREALIDVLSSLEEEDFFEGRHQIIYRCLVSLNGKSIPVDTLTMTEELLNIKEYENVGGAEYLQKCADSMVAISSLEYYIHIVSDQSVLRKMLLAVRDIDANYKNEEIDNVDDFIEQSKNAFDDSIAKRRVSQFKTAEEAAREVEMELNTPREENSEGINGLTTGYEKLNKITQGFHPGDMIIVAARPNVGKTALALNFAYQVAKKARKTVAIFSLEMPSNLLIKRILGCASNVSLKHIALGQFTGVERAKVANGIKEISSLPIYIEDTPNMKMMNIVSEATKLSARDPNLGLIIIDYLGLITSSQSAKNPDSRQEEVRKISLGLKQLARELKVPIIVVSQLSRNTEQRGDSKRPMLSDLRDSGSLEQDADIVMLLYREDYYNQQKKPQTVDDDGNKKMNQLSNEERSKMSVEMRQRQLVEQMPGSASYVEVNVAKNRNGGTGMAPLFFYKDYCRFDDPPKDWEEQMSQIMEQ